MMCERYIHPTIVIEVQYRKAVCEVGSRCNVHILELSFTWILEYCWARGLRPHRKSPACDHHVDRAVVVVIGSYSCKGRPIPSQSQILCDIGECAIAIV